MTIEEVQKRLDSVKDMSGDYEVAHDEEDDLHRDVLAAISNGHFGEASEWASIALRTENIDFPRYCA